jgi:hypothetical protein
MKMKKHQVPIIRITKTVVEDWIIPYTPEGGIPTVEEAVTMAKEFAAMGTKVQSHAYGRTCQIGFSDQVTIISVEITGKMEI